MGNKPPTGVPGREQEIMKQKYEWGDVGGLGRRLFPVTPTWTPRRPISVFSLETVVRTEAAQRDPAAVQRIQQGRQLMMCGKETTGRSGGLLQLRHCVQSACGGGKCCSERPGVNCNYS